MIHKKANDPKKQIILKANDPKKSNEQSNNNKKLPRKKHSTKRA